MSAARWKRIIQQATRLPVAEQPHRSAPGDAIETQDEGRSPFLYSGTCLDRVPRALLPEVKDCADDFGISGKPILGAAIPILGVAGDQHAVEENLDVHLMVGAVHPAGVVDEVRVTGATV